jgi:hypothetical protein
MKTIMLWLDTSKDDLSKKVQRAVDYYVKQYKLQPDLCLVNPNLFEGNIKELKVVNVYVRPYSYVLPNHFWVGLEEKDK